MATLTTVPTPTEQQTLELAIARSAVPEAIATLKSLKARSNSLTVIRAIDSLCLVLDASNE